MYGIVNNALLDTIVNMFGSKILDQVLVQSNVMAVVGPRFVSYEEYPDSHTFDLAHACSKVNVEAIGSFIQITGCAIDTLLYELGKQWVHTTGYEGHYSLLKGYSSFLQFLQHLNTMHEHIRHVYRYSSRSINLIIC